MCLPRLSTPPRVLVIEDQPTVREAVQQLLQYFGYACGTAADGLSGLRRFDSEPWDLVITDLTLPDTSGWHLITVIRTRVPTLPLILITGADDPGVRTRARDCHVSVLLKPFGLDALKAAVIDAFDNRRGDTESHPT
jgi:DNA-binding response OmpR family regulator